MTSPSGLSRRSVCIGAAAAGAFAGRAEAAEDAWAYLAQRNGKALLVWKDGRLVRETYSPGFSSSAIHELWSGSKSFWGPVAACMIEDRLIKGFDESVAETITEWRGDPVRESITLRQVLALQSGLNPGRGGPAHSPTYEASTQAGMLDPPGARFRYGPNNYGVFGAFARRKLKARGEDATAYLQRRILDPIGSKVARWRLAGERDPILQGGAFMTAPDWLQYGKMILDRGRWRGREVIPSSLLDECFRPSPANASYGLTWWLNGGRRGLDVQMTEAFGQNFRKMANGMALAPVGPPDLAAAVGGGGQRLYVSRSLKLAAVVFADTEPFNDDAVVGALLAGLR